MKRVHFNMPVTCWVLLLCCLLPFSGLSQEGDYYVSNFVIEPDRIDNPYFSIERSDDGLIYVSNRSGILKYDGHQWKRLPCPGAVYSMKSHDNIFYVGGKFGFGYITNYPHEQSQYVSLSDSLDTSHSIFKVERKDNQVYFLGNNDLFIYTDSTLNLVAHHHQDSSEYAQMLSYKEELFLVTETGMVEKISGNKLELTKSPFPEGEVPVFLSTNKSGRTLIGSLNDRVYMDDEYSFYEVTTKDDSYLLENKITSGQWLSDSLVAIGTLKGGLAILNTTNWEIQQIINSHTGLSDNEILGLQVDLDNGLWVAQNNGLDRVAPFLPVSNFSHYPGLNGTVASIYPNDTTLFVSTNMGIYYLSKVRDYNEIIDLIQRKVKVEIPVETSRRSTRRTTRQEQTIEEPEEEKKGFFSFLRRKKSSKEDEDEEADRPGLIGRIFNAGSGTTFVQKDSTITERKITRELQSIRYVYKRIEGINSRSSIFKEYENDLLAGGLAGLFQLLGDSSILISEQALRDYHITRDGLVISSDINGVVRFYQKVLGIWTEVDKIEDLRDIPLHIFEDYNNHLWLTGSDLVYKLSVEDTLVNIDEYQLENPYSDRTLGVEAGDKMLFVNPHGTFSLRDGTNNIIRDTTVQNHTGIARKYFQSGGELMWFYNGTTWYRVGIQPGEKSPEVRILNLISDIKFVTYQESTQAFWVVNSKNEIFKLEETGQELSSNYKLVLSDFEDLEVFSSDEVLEFPEREGNVSFEYFMPDYSGVLGIEYRYRLEGLEQDWSSWSADNRIQFPYLPSGDYRITIQSRDIFNQLNQSPTIRFRVVPPYWQQPWFYALEVLLFAALFVLSVRINRSSNSRYLMLNRLLAFLTLILMVEFVQAIAEAKFAIEDSPVVNFFIQVSVAAAILPLERMLRKWLIGETDTERISGKILKKDTTSDSPQTT